MRKSFYTIASNMKNCSFTTQSIRKFLSLMAVQQTEYSNISYKANGLFALVLRAKKNRIEEVALKVLECTDRADQQIRAMERDYAIAKQLPFSDYFMVVYRQFYLTEIDESGEQSQGGNKNTIRKVYFVQEMEMCQGSLHDVIQDYSEKNREPPSEDLKELLAIQMLDAVNMLHQKYLAHGNITTQHILVSSSQDCPVLLKLCNLRFTSPVNSRNQVNQGSVKSPLNSIPPVAEIQEECFEQDLVSLGKVFLQLDSIGSKKCDQLISLNSEPTYPELTTMFETLQLTPTTFLFKAGYSFLSKSTENNQNARSMLLLLLQKQARSLKIPLFSIVLKSHLNSLNLPIPSKRIRLDFLLWQMSRQRKFHDIDNWFDENGERKTDLTIDLLKSALKIMLDWKEFSGQYDVLGVGVGGVFFGAENIKEKRKSALKLSLCTNKAETIREIGIMRICQAPNIVKFYDHKFFKDANDNEFVVYELERCKYSLSHHLELQRIAGEYSDEQKYLLTVQIIDSISFLHVNRTLHRNIKIDSFLITEDRSGQPVAKLSNFNHAFQLQDNFKTEATLEYYLLNHQQIPQVNCIWKNHNRESPLYFAPEKWVSPDLSTYLTDSFAVGLCICILDSWLVCSEEQLAQKQLSFPLGSCKLYLDIDTQISTKMGFKRTVEQLLMAQPQYRASLKNLTEKLRITYGNMELSQDLDENNSEQQMMLIIDNRAGIDNFQQTPIMKYSSLQSVSLNLGKIKREDIGQRSVLNLISNLLNLSKISINFNFYSISYFEAKSLLSPLARLVNLTRVSLNLSQSRIGDIEVKYLLTPLTNLLNLSYLHLNLNDNEIGSQGAQSLLSPFSNLLNLSSFNLDLSNNKIGDFGAKLLLSPLKNLLNLSNLHLNLENNTIRIRIHIT